MAGLLARGSKRSFCLPGDAPSGVVEVRSPHTVAGAAGALGAAFGPPFPIPDEALRFAR
jgi:hypothetical protein